MTALNRRPPALSRAVTKKFGSVRIATLRVEPYVFDEAASVGGLFHSV